MSQQKEAKRFLSALNKQSESKQKDCFSISISHYLPFGSFFTQELYSLADNISLRVSDIDTLVDNLNTVGYLHCCTDDKGLAAGLKNQDPFNCTYGIIADDIYALLDSFG
ncbi:DNA replication licensing factor MCM8, partial [Striga asiatica]